MRAVRPDICGLCAVHGAARLVARAAGEHAGALRHIIHAFKYRGHRSLARNLSSLMCRVGGEVLDGADVIVAVPLHRHKLMRRGFNQAADLARHVPGRVVFALSRRRKTRSQAGLNAHERTRNVRGAFAPSWRARVGAWAHRGRGLATLLPRAWALSWADRWTVAGKTVVLVDDVSTTGATLRECARVLQACGAREVRALTAALVVRR